MDARALRLGGKVKDAKELHSSQQKLVIDIPTGRLSSLRERFESAIKLARTTAPSGEPTAASKRVLTEKSKWKAEHKANVVVGAAISTTPTNTTTTVGDTTNGNGRTVSPEIPTVQTESPGSPTSAVGWDYKRGTSQHTLQTNQSKSSGDKFGIKSDGMDARTLRLGGKVKDAKELHSSQQKLVIDIPAGRLSSLRERFESANKSASTAAPSGEPTAAQQRVLAEKKKWKAEHEANAVAAAAAIPTTPTNTTTNVGDTTNGNGRTVSPEVPTVETETPEVPTVVASENDDINESADAMVAAATISTTPTGTTTTVGDTTNGNARTASPEVPTVVASENEDINESAVQGPTAIVIFDYTAAEEDELTFSVGEIITEIEKIDPGWWKGVCRGRVGLFPCNYVEEQ